MNAPRFDVLSDGPSGYGPARQATSDFDANGKSPRTWVPYTSDGPLSST